jgi:DNA polymerase-3 subunit epsilon
MRFLPLLMDTSFLAWEDQTLAVVDVETTGLYPAFGDRVCEVGIVRAQGGQILDTYQTLVNPQRPISPGAARVNGLSDAEVRQAPRFAEIAGELLTRLDGTIVVCHNAPFDLSFLEAEFERLGQVWRPSGVIDTLDIARRNFRFGSNSLGALAVQLGIGTPHAHRALGDALTTLQVLRSFSRLLAGQEAPPAVEIYDYSAMRKPAVELLPPALQEALSTGSPIEIHYIDANGDETRRTITPLRVAAQNDLVYLVAFCHLRQAERSFRLDRIVAIGGAA